MSALIILHDVHLKPVIELEPFRFATQQRVGPDGSMRELPEEWHRYWSESLADAGLKDLIPLRLGSWHVPLASLTEFSTLSRMIATIVEEWGGADSLTDPEGRPCLSGGLALLNGGDVLAEPNCCVDLTNIADWQTAASYRGSDWVILWTGHPWLSVRYDVNDWLMISGQHESAEPVAQWKVSPNNLSQAVANARLEMEGFAARLEPIVAAMIGKDAAWEVSQKLAGLHNYD